MVKLTIHPSKGSASPRAFPFSGYLGLTPLKVEGVVRTILDDDGKPLQASSIVASVRCIECRLRRGSAVYTNVIIDYSQTLWSKPSSVEFADVGNGNFPFKIIVPAKTSGFSSANFTDYRVFWRVEAVINHAPVFGVGSRLVKYYELPLVRYDATVPSRGPSPSPTQFLITRKPRAPVIRYQLLTPVNPVAPLDIVTIPLLLQPVDSAVVIRGASLVVERRIELNETAALPSPYAKQSGSTLMSPMENEDEDSSGSTVRGFNHDRNPAETSTSTVRVHDRVPFTPIAAQSLASLSSTYTTDSFSSSSEQRALLQPIMTDLPSKTVSLTVAHVDSSGSFTKDASGMYQKSLTLQWPASKSNSHWAMGETMQTELINVRFFIHVKVIVSSPSTGTETIDLEEREVFLISTNESERKLAAHKYMERRASRSKSKSPYRSRRDADIIDASSMPPLPHTAVPTSHLPNRSSPVSSAPSSTPRRPHTSAGPRDKARSSQRVPDDHRERGSYRAIQKEDSRSGRFFSVRPSRPPETANPSMNPSTDRSLSKSQSFIGPSQAFRSSRDGEFTSGIGFVSDPGSVRAWEEELERIELKSRRESDMLGFSRRRTASRPNTASSSVTSTSGSSS